jgi:phosphoribosylamine--glycine ligase
VNILLIGSGGREHALAWKLAQSPQCTRLLAAPGNPGIAAQATIVELDVSDHTAVQSFCAAETIDMVVVGPEAPLVAGLADDLRAAGIATFGPGKAAAQLEGSKAFTKALCTAANIPTAAHATFSDAASAVAGLNAFTPPYVIKADGLAAGKGVVIAENRAVAEAAIADMLTGGFGAAGSSIVIEEFMTGEEVSFFALCDGTTVVPFGSAQDHKRVGDGDTGLNTGGMGAYSPARILTPALEARVMQEIIEPTIATLAAQGTPYIGVLFAGLMLTMEGPKLIEYNCRFGDPECQVLMRRFQGDFAGLLHAVATGTLVTAERPRFSDDSALAVVMAAAGYPGPVKSGGVITIPDLDGAIAFHAGTALAPDGNLIANGGRVLGVTASGVSVRAAQQAAYAAVDAIDFPTGFCRRDIGWREVARERAGA